MLWNKVLWSNETNIKYIWRKKGTGTVALSLCGASGTGNVVQRELRMDSNKHQFILGIKSSTVSEKKLISKTTF